MSGVNSTTPNYSGRQGDNIQGIKQFVTSSAGVVDWIYKTISGSTTKVITPYDQTKTVMIPKDLLVLGSINNPSDINIKTNITKIDDNNIIKLNPVKFNYKCDKNLKFGFVAQEVETIYPNLVSNINGIKHVDYIQLIPLLVNKIIDQELRINYLEELIKTKLV
jgi:hypothetical protein